MSRSAVRDGAGHATLAAGARAHAGGVWRLDVPANDGRAAGAAPRALSRAHRTGVHMKSRLLELLRDLPLPDGRTGGTFAWDQLLLIDNIGRVPARMSIAGDFLWNRGFKALLLNRDGAPQYLCKCRAPGDAWLRRETEIRARLCTEAGLERVIPWTDGTRNHLLQMQISRYVSGSLYQALVPKQTLEHWAASVRTILDGAHLACSTYEQMTGRTSA